MITFVILILYIMTVYWRGSRFEGLMTYRKFGRFKLQGSLGLGKAANGLGHPERLRQREREGEERETTNEKQARQQDKNNNIETDKVARVCGLGAKGFKVQDIQLTAHPLLCCAGMVL